MCGGSGLSQREMAMRGAGVVELTVRDAYIFMIRWK
jgi:hypothetical protein